MIKLKDLLTEAKGDCYQAGGRLIMNFFGDKNHKLVHGMVNGQGALEGKRYGHCWVESSNSVLDHSNGRKLEVSFSEGPNVTGVLVAADSETFTLEWKQREPKPVGKGKITVTKNKKLTYDAVVNSKVVI